MIAPLLLYCVSLVLGVPGLALDALRSDSDGGGPWILASVVAGVLGYLIEHRRTTREDKASDKTADNVQEYRGEVNDYRAEVCEVRAVNEAMQARVMHLEGQLSEVAELRREVHALAMQVAEMRAGGE